MVHILRFLVRKDRWRDIIDASDIPPGCPNIHENSITHVPSGKIDPNRWYFLEDEISDGEPVARPCKFCFIPFKTKEEALYYKLVNNDLTYIGEREEFNLTANDFKGFSNLGIWIG